MSDQTPPENGGRCASCHAPVATDQHYCLSCGARQSAPRVPFGELLARSTVGGGFTPSPHPETGTGAPTATARDWTPAITLGGLAALALVLVVGVLIGRSSSTPAKQAAAQVITVAGGGASATTPTADASSTAISEDWPAGQSGYTVQLQMVAKAGATSASVTAAKSAASGKGAPGVGVLDAANYNSLGGDYIIYSGDYPTEAKAKAALAKIAKSFPGAKVIHVVPGSRGSGGTSTAAGGAVAGGSPVSQAQAQQSAGALNALSSCSGASCSKNARKVTNPVAVGGAPPPVDNKAPGAGSAAQTIN